jgi:streptogrisin C
VRDALAAAVVACAVTSAAKPTGPPSRPEPRDDEWLWSGPEHDSVALAAAGSITLEAAEMERRLRPDIGRLRSELVSRSETFAGLWVNHTVDAIEIVVSFAADEPRAELERYAATFPAADLLVSAKATWTFDELTAAFDAALAARDARGHMVDVWLDEERNVVVLEGPERASVEEVADASELSDRMVVSVADLARPECNRAACYNDAFGGLEATDCTVGFATRDANNDLGVLTAAHCSNTQSHAGNSLGSVTAEVQEGSVDAQFHELPAGWDDWSAVFLSSGTVRAVNSIGSSNTDYVGMTVCQSGRLSGYACGTISSLNYAPSYVPSSHDFRTATYAHGAGDSGAPVFAGTEAWGVHSGNRGSNGHAIYSHVSFVTDALDVSVSTK